MHPLKRQTNEGHQLDNQKIFFERAFKKESQLHKVHIKCHTIIRHAEKQIHSTWREILVSTSLAKLKDFPSAPTCFSLSLSLSLSPYVTHNKKNQTWIFWNFQISHYIIFNWELYNYFRFFWTLQETLFHPNPVLFFSKFFFWLKCK
jgi:hypothetical protein